MARPARRSSSRTSSSRRRPSKMPRLGRAIGLGVALVAGGAALFGVVARRRQRVADATDGHAAPDLARAAPDQRGTDADRAPPAFRPDPTALPTAQEKDALRPAPATGWN